MLAPISRALTTETRGDPPAPPQGGHSPRPAFGTLACRAWELPTRRGSVTDPPPRSTIPRTIRSGSPTSSSHARRVDLHRARWIPIPANFRAPFDGQVLPANVCRDGQSRNRASPRRPRGRPHTSQRAMSTLEASEAPAKLPIRGGWAIPQTKRRLNVGGQYLTRARRTAEPSGVHASESLSSVECDRWPWARSG